MTNPKEVLEKWMKSYYYPGNLKNGEEIGDYWLKVIKSQVLATLTSQLEAIPEDEEEDGTSQDPSIAFNQGINEERQRQRQALQLAIKEWSELK